VGVPDDWGAVPGSGSALAGRSKSRNIAL